VRCTEILDVIDECIRFSVVAKYQVTQQALTVTLPEFYFPYGLTVEEVQTRLDIAVEQVSAEEEDAKPLTNGAVEQRMKDIRLVKQQALQKMNDSHTFQVSRMKEVEDDKDVRQWQRILSSTGAKREKQADSTTYIKALADRDVQIINGTVKGRYTMGHRDEKAFQDKVEASL
jgi:hypothetical protein